MDDLATVADTFKNRLRRFDAARGSSRRATVGSMSAR
jgi:hypothetical protein